MLRAALEKLALDSQLPSTTAAKDMQHARDKNYKFWKTQPVPQFSDDAAEGEFLCFRYRLSS